MLGRAAKSKKATKGKKATVLAVPKRYRRHTEEAAREAGGASGCKTIVAKKRCKGSKKRGTYRCRAIKPVEFVRCASEVGRFKSVGFKSKQRANMKKNVCFKGGKGPQKHRFVRCPKGVKPGTYLRKAK